MIGTLVYTFGSGWSVVDGFYVAVATLTTSSLADPKLTITDPLRESLIGDREPTRVVR